MTQVPYSKPALSYAEQIEQLKTRGLHFPDELKAAHLLEVISYYRMSGYWYPLLLDKENHKFKPVSSFETVFNIYKFDRELRLLITSELEKIEVAVRSKMIYILSHNRGAFWFQDSANFANPLKFEETLSKIGSEYKRCDEEFIKAFKNKYSNPLPPNWMIFEISSFGVLSNLYHNLVPGRDKRAIANYFGLSDKVFTSWLHSIVYLRNICAHHTRLWNRELSIRAEIPRNPHYDFISETRYFCAESQTYLSLNRKCYFVLSMIIYLMNIINPNHTVQQKVKSLLAKYPNIDTRAMGFPDNWKSEALWM